MAKKSEQETQQAYLQMQLIEQQLQQLEQQIVEVENKKQELSTMRDSLLELKKGKKNIGAFSSLGLGIYAKSKLLENENLLVNVGSNIFVEKKAGDIAKDLDKQVKKFEDLSKTLTQNYQIMAVQGQALQAQLHQSHGGK